MRICELHQKYPGQHFPNCKCDTEHEGAVFCAFHKKYPNQWLASCDCGVEEKKLRLRGHVFNTGYSLDPDPDFVPNKYWEPKPDLAPGRCAAMTKAGKHCKKRAKNSNFCRTHQPK